MRSKGHNEKGISRIDTASTKGWYVRAYRNGKIHAKFFSDGKHASSRSALNAARVYRDGLFRELEDVERQPRRRSPQVKAGKSKLGVVGVSLTKKKTPQGKMIRCYSVSWRPTPKVQKCTSFSVEKYGEDQAFLMAVEHRFTMLKRYYGPEVAPKLKSEYGEDPRFLSLIERVFGGSSAA